METISQFFMVMLSSELNTCLLGGATKIVNRFKGGYKILITNLGYQNL